jgi:hypothetical protein
MERPAVSPERLGALAAFAESPQAPVAGAPPAPPPRTAGDAPRPAGALPRPAFTSARPAPDRSDLAFEPTGVIILPPVDDEPPPFKLPPPRVRARTTGGAPIAVPADQSPRRAPAPAAPRAEAPATAGSSDGRDALLSALGGSGYAVLDEAPLDDVRAAPGEVPRLGRSWPITLMWIVIALGVVGGLAAGTYLVITRQPY